MRGIVKTYLSEKQYGFIKGDDGKDYFFHHSSFKNKNDIDKLCEGLYLHFEQKATPKGYSAIQIELVEQNITIGYEIPDTIYTSKNSDIKGWEVIEVSNWIVHGSSINSPDSAKEDMIHGAKLIGANALFNIQYYKTTGSERGTGSRTYYYTIHNFRGRAANIARKSPNGQYNLDDLKQINSNAKTLKTSLVKKTTSAKIKRMLFWLIVFLLISILWIYKKDFAIIGTIGLVILASFLSHATDYDSWLEEIK
ncbi:cold-shock protein [Campylobacter hyointestinalis]|uniref:cold-shock protein n=1 Tax=Campylobacter hyointestinalis TaxID=198 RepID=UPI0015ECC5EE|nr:cold shock domain-containing protein [Campylobacter hyointestinalis]